MNTKKLTRVSLFAALACILRIVPKVPFGAGYVHFGDCIIYVSAILLGPISGAAVGAIGHSLADFISGFPVFCIPTFIIKGIMGFVIGKIVHGHIDAKHFVIGALAAFIIVTGGYFLAEWLLISYEAACVSLISSPIQWAMSMIASAIIVPILIKNRKTIGF